MPSADPRSFVPVGLHTPSTLPPLPPAPFAPPLSGRAVVVSLMAMLIGVVVLVGAVLDSEVGWMLMTTAMCGSVVVAIIGGCVALAKRRSTLSIVLSWLLIPLPWCALAASNGRYEALLFFAVATALSLVVAPGLIVGNALRLRRLRKQAAHIDDELSARNAVVCAALALVSPAIASVALLALHR